MHRASEHVPVTEVYGQQQNNERHLPSASLVIIDRTADLWTPSSHYAGVPLAHRALSTLPRLQGTKTGGEGQPSELGLADISFLNSIMSISNNESVLSTKSMSPHMPIPTTNGETISLYPSSAVGGLQLYISPSILVERHLLDLRRAVLAGSEEEGRAALCSELEQRVRRYGGTLPPPKKRGLGAAVLALVQALLRAPGGEPEVESKDARSGRAKTVAAKCADVLSPSLATIEAMQRSSATQQKHGSTMSHNRSTYDVRSKLEAEVDAATDRLGADGGIAVLLQHLLRGSTTSADGVAAGFTIDLQHMLLVVVRSVLILVCD